MVFYNGRDDFPEQTVLKLSDAFERSENTKGMHPALECEARIININYGHNAMLMEKCTRLMHYSIFIDTVNKYISEYKSLDIAINLAIDECIQKGILTDVLTVNRGEVSHMLLTEFDQKKHDKNMWQDGHDEGYDEGEKVGFNRGEKTGFDNAVIFMLQNGRTPEEISDFGGYDLKQIKEIERILKQNQTK